MLANIRVVLVRTSHSGNVGAAARAMKNMGLTQLSLVAPRNGIDAEARARAAGADDILDNASVCESLEEAVGACQWVVGASARARKHAWPTLNPREFAGAALKRGSEGSVAIVFGAERSGLTNAELELCQALLMIPCNPEFSSLNVAAAVQIVAYELACAANSGIAPDDAPLFDGIEPVSHAQMESFYAHLAQTLGAIGFFASGNPEVVMRRLRRLFGRTQLDAAEVNILRGMCTLVLRGRPGVSLPDGD